MALDVVISAGAILIWFVVCDGMDSGVGPVKRRVKTVISWWGNNRRGWRGLMGPLADVAIVAILVLAVL